ncbi:MAG: cytochrome c1, partial [Rhodomicrobiaceae bacterium]
RRQMLAGLVVVTVIGAAGASWAAEDSPAVPREDWTFKGVTGYFDKAQLRRGYLVYKNVCSACHGMRLLDYRNLSQPGGPEFSEASVKQFAADAQVTDGPDDNGEMFTRPGKPSDHFVSPFPNAKAAAAANGGAEPPDLSLMAKARAIEQAQAWYLEPFDWLHDIVTAYQEQGPDYIHALMTGYTDPPKGVTVLSGMYYNSIFPGHQIAMPPPLSDGAVTYDDGTPATVENYARDVSAFLMWAAEPKLEERKRMGLKVMIYLAILSALLYLSKRALWRDVEH